MGVVGSLAAVIGPWLVSLWAMGGRATQLMQRHEVIQLFSDDAPAADRHVVG